MLSKAIREKVKQMDAGKIKPFRHFLKQTICKSNIQISDQPNQSHQRK